MVVDVSTLRASEDGDARARLSELAIALGASAEDFCGDEEPLMAQMRYVAAMEGGFERTALVEVLEGDAEAEPCLLYTSPSPRDKRQSRMPSSA